MASNPLSILLEATSKEDVLRVFSTAFRHRKAFKEIDSQYWMSLFKKTENEIIQLMTSIIEMITLIISKSSADTPLETIASVIPEDLDPRLRKLIANVIASQLGLWREASIAQSVIISELDDINWRVNLKSASERVSRMNIPTCFVDLKIQNQPQRSDTMPGTTSVNFELSRESLATLLEGMNKIREQLDKIRS